MQFTIYRSTDASAPALSGTVGSLVALLDACLVNGYGSKAAAGWTKVFSGTNKAVYRGGTGVRAYYRVQDDGPGAAAAREARFTGYDTMTDVDTGNNPCPTAALGAGGIPMLVARKSSTADSTARAWIVMADSRTVHVFVISEATALTTYYHFSFGEFYSLCSGDDLGRSYVVGRAAENNMSTTFDLDTLSSTAASSNSAWIYLQKPIGNIGNSTISTRHGDPWKGNNASHTFLGEVPFPNPSDGGLYLSPIWISEAQTSPTIRGRLRGMWHQLHPLASFDDGQTFSCVGPDSGKSFMMIKQSPHGGIYCMEISDTLETN